MLAAAAHGGLKPPFGNGGGMGVGIDSGEAGRVRHEEANVLRAEAVRAWNAYVVGNTHIMVGFTTILARRTMAHAGTLAA